MPELLNEDTKEQGKTLLNHGMPHWDNYEYLIKKFNEVLTKVNPELKFY